ncbi:BACON domain-containing protein [Phocaeicola plebeius]
MKQNILLFILILLISGCSQKEIEPSFSLQEETSSITLASAASSQTVIRFTSTREWKASTSSEWLLISPTSGEAGTYQMALTASSKNNSKNSRTATVNLVSAGLTQSFTVTQSPAEYVELEQTAYYTEAQGGSLQIKFTTNLSTDELAIYGTASWLTQPANSRTDQAYVVNLTVLPNDDDKERTAYLYFCKTNDEEEEILNSVTIIQEGTDTNTSTDYSADKTVRILQRATQGNGPPIVLMGDGFLDTDIVNGTYDEVMNKAMENLFTEEPLKSLQSYFNVYSVMAVSRSNKFDGYNTAFQCQMEGGMSTLITGNDENVIDYIQCVEGIDVSETLTVVVLNSPLYAGTTYFGYYSENQVTELAIAYCPIIYNLENDSFRQVLVHEAVGHGFAKLEDEYSYEENGKMPSDEINDVKMLQSYGWAQNVDFTQDENTILWSSFLNDSRYSSEGIGIYEGACTYMSGVYRPTEDSMMNTNTCGFNAPSRKAIYDMVMRRGENRETTYEEFADFDSRNASQVQTLTRTSNAISRPFTHPHFVHKSINK